MAAAVVFGELVAVSGQVSVDESGTLVGDGDFVQQSRQCFQNLQAILTNCGSSLKGVVQLTTYLADTRHTSEFLALRSEMFPDDPPATTTVIAQLLDPRFLIEIQAMAVVAP